MPDPVHEQADGHFRPQKDDATLEL
jgi:hypothetical protein